MKKNILPIFSAILMLLPGLMTSAQNNSFDWVLQMGGNDDERGNSIVLDELGNIYITGYFRETVDFDPGPGTANLSSVGSADIYVQKLDAAGDLIWVRQFGGTGYNYGNAIALDGEGNVYTTGNFFGTVDFDPGGETFYLSSGGSEDIFVHKLDASGNFEWVSHISGTGWDQGTSIAVDEEGNVYTTGHFELTADFDPGAGTLNLDAGDWADFFVQKLDAAGNLLWVKQTGGPSTDFGKSLAIDQQGNVYTTGLFEETVDFDPGSAVFNLSAQKEDIFVQKLDALGNFVWARQMVGPGINVGEAIDVDSSGNIYTTGRFEETVDFDPGPGIVNLSSAGFLQDVFIQKLDTSGNLLWVKQIGGGNIDGARSITVDYNGNVYTTGVFYGTVDFDPGPDAYNLVSTGYQGTFIQKLDVEGNFLWAKQLGGTAGETFSSAIQTDALNNVYMTGSFYGSLDFDPGSASFHLSSEGEDDIFVLKLSDHSSDTNNLKTNLDILIYPNPTKGLVTIDIGNHPVVDIQVINHIGQRLILKALRNSINTIDLSKYNSGFYYIKISSKEHLATQKMVKY